MNIVITGTSHGIGKATAEKFLMRGHHVIGIDINGDNLENDINHRNYEHVQLDISKDRLPDLEDIQILVNNAGTQDDDKAIDTNLKGLIRCCEAYAIENSKIKSVVNLASVSATNGAEFPKYTASKGGVVSYSRWLAKSIAKYGATCNSISFGGVLTSLNDKVINDSDSWEEIMRMTPLKKWATPEECAEWIYFVSVVNQSMTGQDIIIDNGELWNHKFVW